MSLLQKVKGMSKKVRVTLLCVALGLACAVSGIVAAVTLSGKSIASGSDWVGKPATGVTMGTNLSKVAPDKLGEVSNSDYRYTTYNTSTNAVTAFENIPAATVNGSYFIDTPGKWLYVVDQMNAKVAAYLSGKYIFAGGTMDFGGTSVTPAAFYSANPFTGTIYGNKTTIQNVKFVGTANKSGSTTPQYAGMIAFAQNANFYDLVLNTGCSYSVSNAVASVVGGLIAQTSGSIKLINCGVFANINITHTSASSTPSTNMGGFIGIANTSSNLYFNACVASGYITYDGKYGTPADSTGHFGGFFGKLNGSSTLGVFNSGATSIFNLKRVGPMGGPLGSTQGSTSMNIKAVNVVCRYKLIQENLHSPDFGVLICGYGTTYNAANCQFDNLFLFGDSTGRSESNYDSWLTTGKVGVVQTNMDLRPVDGASASTTWLNSHTNIVKRAASEQAVINLANQNAGIASSGIIVNDDGSIGSRTMAEGTFTLTFTDSLCTDAIPAAAKTYSNVVDTVLPVRNVPGAIYDGWSVGGWSYSPVKVFPAGSRLGDLSLYARYTIDGGAMAASFTSGKQTQTITYGESATYSFTLTHPLVTAGKATMTVDGWYTGNNFTTKLVASSGTATGANSNIAASVSGSTYTLKFTKPAVSQSMTYRLKFNMAIKSGISGVTNSVGYYDITLNVNKKEVENPTINPDNVNFIYDTTEKVAVTSYDKSQANYTVTTSAGSTLNTSGTTGTISTFKAGNYTTTFTLKDANNYKWANTTDLAPGVTLPYESGVLTLNWKVAKAEIKDGTTSGDGTPDPDDPDNDGGEEAGSYVNFEVVNIGTGGRVGLTLNNAFNGVQVKGKAWITLADGKGKHDIPGTFDWENPSELISYENFDKVAALNNNNKSTYIATAVFTPEDPNIAPFKKDLTIIVTGQYINLKEERVSHSGGTSEVDLGKLWVDYGSKVTFAPKFGTEIYGDFSADGIINISYYDGGVLKTEPYVGQAPMGYDAKLTLKENSFNFIGNSNVFTVDTVTDEQNNVNYYGRTFVLGYTPKANTKFTVYYVIEQTSGDTSGMYNSEGSFYPYSQNTSTVDQLEAAVTEGIYAFKAISQGATDSYVSNYIINGKYLTNTIPSEVQQHYEVHSAANTYGSDRISGDGATWIVVHLRAKTYTITFIAEGATKNPMQIQLVKYKGLLDKTKIDDPVKTKTEYARFEGWFTAANGGNPVSWDEPVRSDAIYYAHFTDTYYYVVFRMNAFNDDIDKNIGDGSINLRAIPTDSDFTDVYHLISWNYSALFGIDDKGSLPSDFSQSENLIYAQSPDTKYAEAGRTVPRWNRGDYVYRYTVDTLTKNLSLTATVAKPSAAAYTFKNWYTTTQNEDGSFNVSNATTTLIRAPKSYTSSQVPQDIITLTAKWDRQVYSIVFDKQDGSRTVTLNGNVNLSTWDSIFARDSSLIKPTRVGYRFSGWFTLPGGFDDGGELVTEMSSGYFSVADYLWVVDADGEFLYYNVYDDPPTFDFSIIRLFAVWEETEINVDDSNWKSFEGGQIETVNPIKVAIGKTITVSLKANKGYRFSYLAVVVKDDNGNTTERYVYVNGTAADGGTTRLTLTVYSSDIHFTSDVPDEDGNYEHDPLRLEAYFEPVTYTISYEVDGGRSYETSVNRAYTVKTLQNGVKLPSLLDKEGYNFVGWEFYNTDNSIDGSNAFNLVDDNGRITGSVSDPLEETNYFGKLLILSTNYGDSQYLGNLQLKAKWAPKAVTVKFYNTNYNSTTYAKAKDGGNYYVTDDVTDGVYTKIYFTGDTVDIVNPESGSFIFLGWATKSGGDVVYPAIDGKTTVSYVASSDYSSKVTETEGGKYLLTYTEESRANCLYAVWKIEGFDYVMMSAENNNTDYTSDGIDINARTSKPYSDDETNKVTITYSWYRVNAGKDTPEIKQGDQYVKNEAYYAEHLFRLAQRAVYDDTYTVICNIYYKENGDISSWVYYNNSDNDEPTTGTNEPLPEAVTSAIAKGQYIDERVLVNEFLSEQPSYVGENGYVSKIIKTDEADFIRKGNTLADPVTHNVANVSESGIYICVAKVSNSANADDNATNFGEITIEMYQAEFRDLVLKGKSTTYDGTPKSLDKVALSKSIPGTTNNTDTDEITLEDGTIITVSYRYKTLGQVIGDTDGNNGFHDSYGNVVDGEGYLIEGYNGEGEDRTSIYAQSAINVGEYVVTAMFAIKKDEHTGKVIGRGNYTVIEKLNAELEITKKRITSIAYDVSQDEVSLTGDKFNVTFNEKEFVITAQVADTDMYGNPLADVLNGKIGIEVKFEKLVGNVWTSFESLKESGAQVGDYPINAGTYRISVKGLTGEHARNYEPANIMKVTQTFNIAKAKRDYGIRLADKVEKFDNTIKTIEYEANEELPEELTPVYTVNAMLNEDSLIANGTKGAYGDRYAPNNTYVEGIDDEKYKGKDITNGGRHAGVYEITLNFEDDESENYEKIETTTATLTIEKADLVDFYKEYNGTELIGSFNGNFTYAYGVKQDRMMFLPDTVLTDTNTKFTEAENGNEPMAYFDVHYTVTRVSGSQAVTIASGTKADIEAIQNTIVSGEGATEEKAKIINAPGAYVITVDVSYNSALYRNNFEDIKIDPVEITIQEGVIENITVTYNTAKLPMVQYIGETFDMSYITQFDIKWQGDADLQTISSADFDLVDFIYDDADIPDEQLSHFEFWRVGTEIPVVFSIYGVRTTEYDNATMKVMHKITEGVVLQYSQGGAYSDVPADGLSLDEVGNYTYRMRFTGIDEYGIEKELTADVLEDWIPETLKRGPNLLTLGVSGLYDFTGLYLTLDAYKDITADGDWKYSTDGLTWTKLESNELIYVATEYYIGISFIGDEGNEIVAIVNNEVIRNVGSYNISASEVYTNGEMYDSRNTHYHLTNLNYGRLTIMAKELSFVWEHEDYVYDGNAKLPEINLLKSGVFEADADKIMFTYAYYMVNTYSDGVVATAISPELIVNAGDYRIVVTKIKTQSTFDSELANNYCLPETMLCEYNFSIAKANISATITYDEYPDYGTNVSFEKNPQGLRTDKLVADFGEDENGNKITVAGALMFITYLPDGTPEDLNPEQAGALYLATAGKRPVYVMFAPDDIKNYNSLIVTIELDVRSQTKANYLVVEKRPEASPFYVVDNLVGPDRIIVYEVYTSYYEEKGVKYGIYGELDTNYYKVEANGQIITSNIKYTVLDGDDYVRVSAYRSTNSNIRGYYDFKVYKSEPISLTLNEENRRKLVDDKTWYVNETFDVSALGITFNLNFKNEAPVELKYEELSGYTVSGVGFTTYNSKFTSTGTATVVFAYANLTCSVDLEITPQKDLAITTKQNQTIKYDEKAHDVPVLANAEYANIEDIEGITVTYQINRAVLNSKGSYDLTKVDKIYEVGTYIIYYYITVDNVAYKQPEAAFRIMIEVREQIYEAHFKEWDETLESPYTGEKQDVPVAQIDHIISLADDTIAKIGADLVVDVTRDGIKVDEVIDVGVYTVKVTAYYGDDIIGETEYYFYITVAENSATLNIKNIVVGQTLPYGYTGLKFGEGSAMITFSNHETLGFTETVPSNVGVWYIKLYVPGTSNYRELEIVKKFTISHTHLQSEETDDNDDYWVDVEGGESGISPEINLEVTRLGEEELGGMKVKNSIVEDGYDIALRNSNGEDMPLTEDVTIRLLISEELRDAKKLSVRMVTYDENGKVKYVEIEGVERSEDGKYLVFTVSSVGRFIITERHISIPVALLVIVILLALIAIALIVADVLVYIMKKRAQ